MLDISKLLHENYKNVSIDYHTEKKLKKFIELYETYIKESVNSSLAGAMIAFKTITPEKMWKTPLKKFKNLPKEKKNVVNLLNILTYSLIRRILDKTIECQKTLYDNDITKRVTNKTNIIIYNSCTIWAISNDHYLSKIAEKIGITIPEIPTDKETLNEKRTEKQLRDILKSYHYKGIDNFSKKMLMFLLPDEKRIDTEYDKFLSKYKEGKYRFIDILNWSDLDIEKNKKFIISLFPNPDIISDYDKKKYFDVPDIDFSFSIIYVVIRIILFFGFKIDRNLNITSIKPLFRVEDGIIVGIYAKNTFKLVKSIIKFLMFIRMEYFANLLLLVICKSTKADDNLYKKFNKNNKLKRLLKLNKNFNLYIDEKITKLYGLNYNHNSCYIDSTLMALLGPRNSIIKDVIIDKDLKKLKSKKLKWVVCSKDKDLDIKLRENIQNSIKDIGNKIMRKNTNVENLRNQIKKCPGIHKFHETDTQDAGEFLTYIMNLFQIDISNSIRKTYGKNKVTDKWKLQSKLEDKNTSPIINIESTSLLNISNGYDITNFIKQKQYSTFDDKNKWYPKKIKNPNLSFLYKKEILKVTESPIVMFNLLRTYGEPIYSKNNEFIKIKERNIWKNIKAPESFILHKTKLNLVSIVVHTGGAHYVCNFKFMNDWYWYDDSPFESSNNIKKIGKYSDMINTEPNPLTHGTIFIYVKDDKYRK